MNYGLLLLNKVVEENDVKALVRHGIRPEHFATQGERDIYAFIEDYAAKHGKAPSYAVLTEEFDAYTYVPDVEDSFTYLTEKLKGQAARAELIDFIKGAYADEFLREADGLKLADLLAEKLAEIKRGNSTAKQVGVSLKTDTQRFKDEYALRKAGESAKQWRSKYGFMNDAGGYIGGNVYVVYGRSGRGKSAWSLDEIVELAFQGANCLVWLLEMGWFEGLVRLYTYISARLGKTIKTIDGVDFEAGFDSGTLRRGQLPPDFEAEFMTFLDEINEILPGNITVRGVDDSDFSDRTLRVLESDIETTKADVVLVDPFYYLDYEKNTSKTAGGDAANTSKALRRMTGKLGCVTFAITQADETDEQIDSAGVREVALPKRKDVSKTKALLQDAAVLIAVDTVHKESRGIVGLNKGRDGGEDDFAELIYLPQIGVIKALETGGETAKQFGF